MGGVVGVVVAIVANPKEEAAARKKKDDRELRRALSFRRSRPMGFIKFEEACTKCYRLLCRGLIGPVRWSDRIGESIGNVFLRVVSACNSYLKPPSNDDSGQSYEVGRDSTSERASTHVDDLSTDAAEPTDEQLEAGVATSTENREYIFVRG